VTASAPIDCPSNFSFSFCFLISSAASAKQRNKKSLSNETHGIVTYQNSISDEILERILRKLPITTLIECRYACKSWRDIISGSHFGKLQFLTGDPQCPYPLDRKQRKRSLCWI
jgi:hypothetical protein